MRVIALMIGGLLAGTVSGALAQERQFGVKAGVNVAALSFSGNPEGSYDDKRIGLTAGAFTVLPLAGPLALQLEGLFSQKGASLTVEEADVSAALEIDYLDFPVLARFNGPALGTTRLHGLAGPMISYRMGAKSRLSYTGFDFEEGSLDNIEDDVVRFDLGLVVGAGADIGRRLVVDARYAWGLRNAFKDPIAGEDVKHRVLTVMAGVRF